MTNALLALSLAVTQSGDLPHALYRAQMAAAESAERLGELAVARTWLDQTDPALRGFEWRVRDAGLDESLESVRVAAERDAYGTRLAVSPDGAALACGTSDGRVELRASVDGGLLAELPAHAEAVTSVRFDARGERLVTTSYDRTVKVWDVASRALDVEFKGHGFPVGAADFAPDGELVASCSYERPSGTVVGTVRLWQASDGSLVRTLEGGRKPLVDLSFSPDGKRLAAASWDFCVFVWSVEGGEPLKCAVPDEGIYNAVDGVAWSPDGALVAGASKDRTVRVWNSVTAELVATLRGHTDYVGKLAFSPDGLHLASASSDGTLRLWRVSDWSVAAALRGHADDAKDVVFAPQGARLFSVGQDRTLRTWDARAERYGGLHASTTHAVYQARFSPDDARLATATYNGRIQLWDAATLAELASWQAHPEDKSCHALAWSADGRLLVSGSWEPVVRVWDAQTQAEVCSFEQESGTQFLDTSPRGTLAAICAGSKVVLYDYGARAKVGEFGGHAKAVLAARFSPDGSRVASAGRDGVAHVWDVAARTLAFTVRGASEDVAEAAFTPDGKFVVVADRSGVVRLHDASDGRLVRDLARLRHGINHLEVSPDGSRATVSSNTLLLIDVEHGGVVGQFWPHLEAPYGLGFDHAGLRLASVSTDHTLVVLDVRALRDR